MVIDDHRRKHSQQNPKEMFLRSTYRFDDDERAGFAAVCPEGSLAGPDSSRRDKALGRGVHQHADCGQLCDLSSAICGVAGSFRARIAERAARLFFLVAGK
jgi:hypothetical protein